MTTKLFNFSVNSLAAALIIGSSLAQAENVQTNQLQALNPNIKFGSVSQAPTGYDDYLTYIGNGTYDPSVPADGHAFCSGGVCLDDSFMTGVQGRSESEIAVLEEQAKEFFIWRFGVDVDDPSLAGRILFTRWTIDPRASYRAYVMAGNYVPKEGYEVRDGGWMLQVLDPAGITLGGEFEGQVVPAGSFALIGEYNILIEGRRRSTEKVISYRAGRMVLPTAAGPSIFSCDLKQGRLEESEIAFMHIEHTGLAQGTVEGVANSDGTVTTNLRNSITFSDNSGL